MAGTPGETKPKQSFQEYRIEKTEAGLQYQDFVVDVAHKDGIVIQPYTSRPYQWRVGESRNGTEIKFDMRMSETGNVYIEVAEKAEQRDGDYVDSGIMRNDHWQYVIGDYDVIYIFHSTILRQLYKLPGENGKSKYTRVENDTKTSRGFLVPKGDAERYAGKILKPMLSKKMASCSDVVEVRKALLP